MTIRDTTPADIPALFRLRPRSRENALPIDELRRLGIIPDSVAAWPSTTPPSAKECA